MAEQPEFGQPERHLQLRSRPRIRRQQPPHLSEPAAGEGARRADLRPVDARVRVLRTGQVAAEVGVDAQLRCALRPRADAVYPGSGNLYFSDSGAQYPVDKGNLSPRIGIVWNPDNQGKSVIRSGSAGTTTARSWGRLTTSSPISSTAPSFTANSPRAATSIPDLRMVSPHRAPYADYATR